MALVKCKECKKEVSDKAKECPHCGVKEPGVTVGQKAGGCLIMIVIFAAIVYYFSSGDSDDKTSKTNPAVCEATDGECIANSMMINPDVITACKSGVEKYSKFEYEWTDGFTSPLFSRYLLKQDAGQIVLLGDQVKFTNGFNAKSTMTYHCTVDIKKKSVVSVQVAQGLLQ